MSASEEMFSRIRRSLGAGNDNERRAAVAARLAQPPIGVIPARASLNPDARLALFSAMAGKAQASLVRLTDRSEIPVAAAEFLRQHSLPPSLRRGEDKRLADLSWAGQSQLSLAIGATEGSDLTAISHAEAGVAETGTLVLLSGKDNPTTLNFLPENHIVVVEAKNIVGSYEAAFEILRARFPRLLPRTLNLITGPSRSADIEQTLQLGAHGPKRLHIVLVGPA